MVDVARPLGGSLHVTRPRTGEILAVQRGRLSPNQRGSTANAKILEIGDGTSEIQRLVIARGLGLPVE